MTVAELIESLRGFDPSLQVEIAICKHAAADVADVRIAPARTRYGHCSDRFNIGVRRSGAVVAISTSPITAADPVRTKLVCADCE